MEPILFVAPFPGLTEMAQQLINEMGLELPVVEASNEQAFAVLQEYPDVNVIISRGGTATDLKTITNLPIVEVSTAVSDLLPIVQRLASAGIRKIGVVTKANIIEDNTQDFSISDVHIYMRPCRDDSEMPPVIQCLHSQGVEAIIGCKKAIQAARKLGLVTDFLASGRLSVKKAIEEAVKIVRSQGKERLQVAQLNAIINNIHEGVIVVSHDKNSDYCNQLGRKIFADSQGVIRFDTVQTLLKDCNEEMVINVKGNQLLLRITPLYINGIYKSDVITFQEVSRIENNERKVRISSYQKGLYAKKNFNNIIYQSKGMQDLVEKAKKFAQVNTNILIYGETGTGKEGLAQSIHNASERKNGPFVSVNCASIPASLIESELFGYVDGAFTGARKSGKRGLFELAHGGTIFLDEIGELPVTIQSRLLRTLQEREVMRIGDDKILPLDLRVICATNKDLKELVSQGAFRQDLYYRINVLKLRLPPLRERREDILLLLDFYLKYGQNTAGLLTKKAREVLMRYSWPGNIRELKNVAEILRFYSGEVIDEVQILELLEDSVGQPAQEDGRLLAIHADASLKEMESEILEKFLEKYSAEDVCRKLGISRVTLWRKMKLKNETRRISN